MNTTNLHLPVEECYSSSCVCIRQLTSSTLLKLIDLSTSVTLVGAYKCRITYLLCGSKLQRVISSTGGSIFAGTPEVILPYCTHNFAHTPFDAYCLQSYRNATKDLSAILGEQQRLVYLQNYVSGVDELARVYFGDKHNQVIHGFPPMGYNKYFELLMHYATHVDIANNMNADTSYYQ